MAQEQRSRLASPLSMPEMGAAASPETTPAASSNSQRERSDVADLQKQLLQERVNGLPRNNSWSGAGAAEAKPCDSLRLFHVSRVPTTLAAVELGSAADGHMGKEMTASCSKEQ